MESNLKKITSLFSSENEVFGMVSFKDMILILMGLCMFFALGSFLRGDVRSAISFVIITLMALVIYQAMIPSPLSWKIAITVLLFLVIVLVAYLSPASVEIIASRVPKISSG